VWIEYLRPKGFLNIKERGRAILQKEEVVSCGIILVEILRGAKNEKDFESLRDSLMALPQIPIDGTVIERASKWGFLLDRKGRVVSTTDIIIASAAYKNALLLHSDKDFDTIASIVDLEQERI
jgi:predicted nucleic acid-binding protein